MARRTVNLKLAQRQGMFINVEDAVLPTSLAIHYHMSMLSGGHKVKAVLTAAMWMPLPIGFLDEPMHHLDHESLGCTGWCSSGI